MVNFSRIGFPHHPCRGSSGSTGQFMTQQTAGLPTSLMSSAARRFPIGAEPQRDRGVHFRVWAPQPAAISLVLVSGEQERDFTLVKEGDGYYSVLVEEAAAGSRYWYRVDG